MNVSDLQSLTYSTAGISANVSTTGINNGSSGSVTKTDSTSGQNGVAFSSALSEEVSKLVDTYKDKVTGETEDSSKVTDFKKLASVLDGSVLGTMTANATDSDLAALSEDLLGTGGGREVLAKLMEGHFNSIVMSDSNDDDNEKDVLDNAVDSYNETVSETQALVDSLEKVSTALQQ